MTTIPIFYVGRKVRVTDNAIAGTGLTWVPGQSHDVPHLAAEKLLRHPDVWATDAPTPWTVTAAPAGPLAAMPQPGMVCIPQVEYDSLLSDARQLAELLAQAVPASGEPPPTPPDQPPAQPVDEAAPPAADGNPLKAMSDDALEAHLAGLSDDEVRAIGNGIGKTQLDGRSKGQALRVKVFDLIRAA